ncbi:uncharacterized protein [Apostichopus japonicus]|uniref:uncharacterized protein n=1 Tax=Stichopus japonicus TaxID=307972 RepID=UPI003AB1B1CF
MSVSPPILQQMENLENISADSTPCTSATNVGDYQTCERRILEQLRDVTVMNDKWQKYNKERERYVDGIRRDLEKTKKKLQARDKELMEMKARERELEKTIRDNQNIISNFSKLMDDLDEKEAKERTLSMRVCELEKEVDSLRRMNNTTEANAENEQLLQQQLQICIEDFKTEKKEKNKYKQEAISLRKKSMEAESLLQDYQEKIALIKSLEFPTMAREDEERYRHQRRQSSAHPRRQTNCKTPKPSSWPHQSDLLMFGDVIEADSTSIQGSQSDSAVEDRAVEQVGATARVPVKPLFELFPQLKLPSRSSESAFEMDSVFEHEHDEGELIRR